MTKAHYSQRKRQWSLYNRFEQKMKAHSLKKLSEAGGIKILNELFNFMHEPGVRRRLNKLEVAKIKTLSHVHSMFGRIKG